MPETSLPSFVEWSSFPFEGVLRVKKPEEPVDVEPPRLGEDAADCPKCHAPDEAYIWVNENWRVRSMDRPSGLPMVLILESRSHLDLGDLPNMLAAELGVMTVRLERAIRSIDGVARVHVNRWGDGAAHLHLWFMARPYGRLQLRGTFLTLWDEILPPIPEHQWRENLALIAAWLAEFGGEPLAKPPRIDWKAPASFAQHISTPDASAELSNGDLVPEADVDAAPEGRAGSPGSGAVSPANPNASQEGPGSDPGPASPPIPAATGAAVTPRNAAPARTAVPSEPAAPARTAVPSEPAAPAGTATPPGPARAGESADPTRIRDSPGPTGAADTAPATGTAGAAGASARRPPASTG